jgi:hypothetical protein
MGSGRRWAVAVLGVFAFGIVAWAVVIAFMNLRSAPFPQPSHGMPIASHCQPVTNEEYFFPADSLIPERADDEDRQRDAFSRFLRLAGAQSLSCGNRSDTAYRFMWIEGWSRKSKVVTVLRSSGQWTLAAATFKPFAVARWEVESRFEKRLSRDDANALIAALERTDFWWMETTVPFKGYSYDGATWVIEGRSTAGYHVVQRTDYSPKNFKDVGRMFLKLAGLRIENDE